MSDKITGHERRVYLNHIRRLETDNRILASVIADERRYRINDAIQFRKRLKSKFWNLFDVFFYLQSRGLEEK
jgi:hypothetical protein